MTRFRTRTGLLIGLLAASSLLCACAPLIVGGAAVGSALVVTDRRTSGAQLEDESIELKAGKLIGDLLPDRGHVNDTSYNRIVLLSGEVPNEADKSAVEQAIKRLENVRSVVNELAVGPNSSIGTRSSDTIITSKVKATYVDAKDLQANAIKVVTERGVVYLMGIVTEREAGRAADLAAGVSGVLKVVRVFEVVSEQDLANISSRPKAP